MSNTYQQCEISKDEQEKYRREKIASFKKVLKALPAGIKSEIRLLNDASDAVRISKVWMYWNYLLTAIFFGDLPNHYIEEEMYRYNWHEKRYRYSYWREYRIDHLYNKGSSRYERRILNRKELFVKSFSELLGRETMFAPDHTDEEITAFVQKFGKVIAKPVDDYGGHGIFKLAAEDLSAEKLLMLHEKEYLLEELIVQHSEMAKINSSSVNTIRIISVLDCEGGIHLVDGYIRAGINGSVTDNVSSGGVQYPIDPETGIVIALGCPRESWNKYIFHPGTDLIMPGFQIPNYDKVKEVVEKASRVIPNIRRVGWDVAVTQDGAVIIEGNQCFPGGQEVDGINKYRDAKQYLRPKKGSHNA